MTSFKWRKTTFFLLLCGVLTGGPVLVRGQGQDVVEAPRKLLSRKPPKYPDIARRMSITGVVRLEIVIGPNGVVKSVAVKGGHPLLAQAAQDSVRDWRWETASHETREIIEIKFDNAQ